MVSTKAGSYNQPEGWCDPGKRVRVPSRKQHHSGGRPVGADTKGKVCQEEARTVERTQDYLRGHLKQREREQMP